MEFLVLLFAAVEKQKRIYEERQIRDDADIECAVFLQD